MKVKIFIQLILLPFFLLGQEEANIEGFYSDPSAETQYAFVQELLYIAGYVPEKIEIYQTLPNHAHVYRVQLDSVNGGFMFVRWDKNKKEHYLANKMIDPGLYYNLNVAREMMRKQAQKTFFDTEDIAIQASDQQKFTTQDIQELRQEYDSLLEEKRLAEKEVKEKQYQKEQRKIERKKGRKKIKN